jgi:AcrR family transcriptional regulator
MAERLSPDDWTHAALAALAEGGTGAIRIEALARRLGVSKGSFYWHFKDLPSLLQVVLTTWEDQASAQLFALAEAASSDPVERLLHLAEMIAGATGEGPHLEAAMRDWARRDPAAGSVQARVDRRRLAYLAAAFDGVGCAEPMLRARVMLAGLVGAQNLGPADAVTRRAQLALLLEALIVPQPSTADPASPSAR